jgi:glycine/D-amino acid oxidase-like deaminating enzyme/nitrite reductase/ring-hydroxylating ferredoxin subunit
MTKPRARTDSGRTRSIWMETEVPLYCEPLPDKTGCDVCVIGAGIAGLSVAYELAREGVRVVVIDDGSIGGGATGRTTAHLSSALDDRYYVLEQLHGREGARLAAESHSAAISRIETIAREEEIECELERVDGCLFAAPGQSTRVLERELEAARRAGLGVELVADSCLTSFQTGPHLRFAHQAQFHPMRYLTGLAGAIVRRGGAIHTGVRATRVEGGKPCRVTTEGGAVISSTAIVVATNSPVHNRVAIHTKQAAYRSYVIAAQIEPGKVAHALYWDTLDPYHYVRIARGGEGVELLVVGGEDHRTGQADDGAERHRRLEAWMRERFPLAGAVVARWSGQIQEPADGLAFIGRSPGPHPNVMLVTGDSGNGMTHGALGGILLGDLLLGRENPWAELYDPSRMRLGSIGDWTLENIKTGVQYADWLSPGEVGSVEQIQAGDGAVVRRGLRKLAIYRDDEGRLFTCSARCSHLGAVVAWNSTEKTWDCPAHGSRFDAYGRAVMGPACGDLEPIGIEADDERPADENPDEELEEHASEHREGLPLQ